MLKQVKKWLATGLLMTASQVALADVVYDLNGNVFTGDINNTSQRLVALSDTGQLRYMFNVFNRYDLYVHDLPLTSASFSTVAQLNAPNTHISHVNVFRNHMEDVAQDLTQLIMALDDVSARDVLNCPTGFCAAFSPISSPNNTGTLTLDGPEALRGSVGTWNASTQAPNLWFSLTNSSMRNNVAAIDTFVEDYRVASTADVSAPLLAGVASLGLMLLGARRRNV